MKKIKRQDRNLAVKTRKTNQLNKMTPIATGIAVISGVAAIGFALTDEKNRRTLSKNTFKGLEILQNVATAVKEEPEKYQAIAHDILPQKKGRGTKKKE